MYQIEATVRPERLSAVKNRLAAIGQHEFEVTEVRDCGSSTRQMAAWRGIEYDVEFTRRMCVRLQVADDTVDSVVEAIVVAAYTGTPGDGKLVLTQVSEVLDICSAGQSVEPSLLRTA